MTSYQKFLFGSAPDAIKLAQAYPARVGDMLIKIKEDLGVDDLILAIEDSRKIASTRVSSYLANYETKVIAAVQKADENAIDKYKEIAVDQTADAGGLAVSDNSGVASGKRSLRNIEKLVALSWKSTYENMMEDANAQMPLAQQIVSKYMSNFNVRARMT
jgi:hypothetical protein